VEVENSFFESLDQLGPFEDEPIIAVGVSGGSDSMALVDLANRWANRTNGKVVALIVDHGLRSESAKESEQVKSSLEKMGIESHILCWVGVKPLSNIQAKAREARSRLLTDWCKKNKFLHLLLGHTMDDQSETLYIRLKRGSGVDGLSAMSRVIKVNQVRILRPLLGLRRVDLQEYLIKSKIEWINDPSNENERFERVKVRSFLNEDELFKLRLANTASHMGRARAGLEAAAMQLIIESVRIDALGFAVIDLVKFANFGEEEQLRALVRVLSVIGGKEYKPRFESLTRLISVLQMEGSGKSMTLHYCRVINKGDIALVVKEKSKDDLRIPLSASLCWDGRFVIEANIEEISSRIKEEVYVDFLTEEEWGGIKKVVGKKNIPSHAIYTLPALKISKKVVAVPQIKFYDVDLEKYVRIWFRPRLSLSGINLVQ
jgi:tRNA(Ile)-lysidine synthase